MSSCSDCNGTGVIPKQKLDGYSLKNLVYRKGRWYILREGETCKRCDGSGEINE